MVPKVKSNKKGHFQEYSKIKGSSFCSATSGSTTISMVIGSTTLTVNGQAQTMDIALMIRDGRTYLPARYAAEAFGFSVSWDAAEQINIKTRFMNYIDRSPYTLKPEYPKSISKYLSKQKEIFNTGRIAYNAGIF
jgi:hypothetical protein